MSPSRGKANPAPVRLPADLVGPVDVELAKLTESIPGQSELPGGSRYVPKWDGYLH